MMVHLKRAGILGKIAGLVVGHFTDMKDNAIPFGENAYEIICRNIAAFDIPVAFGFEIGHAPQNLPVVVGQSYLFIVDETGARLDFL
jgi:muramoyltetrapeptide carboxypeptidase